MKFCSTALAALAALFATAAAVPLEARQGSTITAQVQPGRYIVTLKDGVDMDAHLAKIKKAGQKVKYEYRELLNGYAVEIQNQGFSTLNVDPDILEIEPDGEKHTLATQTGAPWGLQRISQLGRVSGSDTSLSFTYNYGSTGSGVDVYVVDTGVRISHSEFGGRARYGFTAYGSNANDGNGHGTHCAGTIAGSNYGVAKGANVIAVKVLSDSGSGSDSDVIAGVNYVAQQARSSGRASIASLSLGGDPSNALDRAVQSAIDAGVHFVVAAGNDNVDASSSSPARVSAAITVAASDINDRRASFSNYGSIVDIFAPGVNIISSYINSDTSAAVLSGTSMATPHVAGLVATLIGARGNSSPASIASLLKSLSNKNRISDTAGSPNELGYNGSF